MKLPINYNSAHWAVRKKAREQYVEHQEGRCWYCKMLLSSNPSSKVASKSINKKLFPAGMFNHPVHLHHDRKTGLTLGATHARCNAYMWQYLGE
jgi:hypothetical protein